jgi:hypothetical protein
MVRRVQPGEPGGGIADIGDVGGGALTRRIIERKFTRDFFQCVRKQPFPGLGELGRRLIDIVPKAARPSIT